MGEMVAGDLEAKGRTHQGPPVTRAELELAIRTELVDFGATSWHARVAADYILTVVDDYVRAQRERLEKRLEEVVKFYLGTESGGDRRSNPDLARWMVEDCHRVLCGDPTHEHEETPWSVGLSERV